MEKHIKCLVEACKRQRRAYGFIDKEQNFLRVSVAGRWEYFQLNKTPFNSEVAYALCTDKFHSYQLLKDTVRMPLTCSFLDFAIGQSYDHYLQHDCMEDALASLAEQFSYPLVVKNNRGALGINVFLCEDEAAAEQALRQVFNQNSRHYDYVAVVQAFIPTQVEYRLLCAYGKPVFAYQRGNAAPFNARYWEHGEQASLISDAELLEELYQFVKPVFAELRLGLVGFDIIRATDGKLYLIELNSSPQFNHIIVSSGEDCVIALYEQLLQGLEQQPV